MHTFWLTLFSVIAALWIFLGGRAVVGMRRLPDLASLTPAADEKCPGISVLFAARDEQEKLPAALQTLLALDYPQYEVVAVNDRSQDATPQILDEFARTSKRLKAVHITELPSGWLGKPHGLQTAYEHAAGEWLVFTDADAHFAPSLLRRAVALAQQRGWDHLTLLAGIEMRGLWEKVAIGYFGVGFVLGQQPWRADQPDSPYYMGVGAFQLIRRSTYEAVGTHRRLALEVIDDMKLGKLVKRGGFRSGVAVGSELVRVHWHHGLRSLARGVTKNMFAGCGFNAGVALAGVLSVFSLSILPFLGVAFGTSWTRLLAGVAAAAAIVVHELLTLRTPAYPLSGLMHPIGAALFCYMLVRSTVVTLWRGGIVWRDTFYPLRELKGGLV